MVDIRICPRCGVGRTFPVPAVDILESGTYQDADKFQLRESYFERTRAYYRGILVSLRFRFGTTAPRLLDVGCSVGALLVEARALGFLTVGLEINEHAAAIGRSRYGLDIRASSVEDIVAGSESYDVITMTQTLEHLRRPQDALSALVPLLRDGEIIVVEVPNFRGFYARLMGHFWPAWSPSQHLCHFSDRTIGVLATYGRGLRLASVSTRRCIDYHFVPTKFRPIIEIPASVFSSGDNVTAVFERA